LLGGTSVWQKRTEYSEDWHTSSVKYEGWNFNSGNYLVTTDTK